MPVSRGWQKASSPERQKAALKGDSGRRGSASSTYRETGSHRTGTGRSSYLPSSSRRRGRSGVPSRRVLVRGRQDTEEEEGGGRRTS